MADFAAALDEETAAFVSVAVVPDTSDFEAALDEQVGDIAVPVRVRADTRLSRRPGRDRLAAGLGGIPVTVVPDMADFADAVEEEAGGIAVPVTVTPDMGNFADAIQEQAERCRPSSRSWRTPPGSPRRSRIRSRSRGEGIVIPVTADTSSLLEGLEEIQEAESSAAAGASSSPRSAKRPSPLTAASIPFTTASCPSGPLPARRRWKPSTR